jgi:hypothetical protein
MVLGSTQPVTGMSISNLGGCKGWPAHKADNLTAVCELSENVGAWILHNTMCLHGLLQGLLDPFFMSMYDIVYNCLKLLLERYIPHLTPFLCLWKPLVMIL